MTSPPDKIFRDGLEHHRKAAPASAWERIESGLERKKHKSPWFKIAATLLLLIVPSFVIWQLNETDIAVDTILMESGPVSSEQSAVSSHQSTDGNQESVLLSESSDVSREAVVKGESAGVSREAVVNRESSGVSREALKGNKTLVDNYTQEDDNSKKPKTSSLQSSVFSLQPSTEKAVIPDESQLAATTDPPQITIEPTQLTQEEITHETSNTDASSDLKRTSITYTANEVNKKFLKKESTSQATPEKKNTSGIQKVIDLALDFKYEGSVLGDIREKKNELLSFNMPSNKRETNK